MSATLPLDNRVKLHRQGRGWSQAELAARAAVSRTAVSAIEARRLVPSVAAAMSLARVLGTTVEELFGPRRPTAQGGTQFAWLPVAFPCRYWAAEVAGRTLLFPVENGPRGGLPHDGVAQSAMSPTSFVRPPPKRWSSPVAIRPRVCWLPSIVGRGDCGCWSSPARAANRWRCCKAA